MIPFSNLRQSFCSFVNSLDVYPVCSICNRKIFKFLLEALTIVFITSFQLADAAPDPRFNLPSKEQTFLKHIKFQSNDKSIDVKWNVFGENISSVEIGFTNSEGKQSQIFSVPASAGDFSFSSGMHGQLYSITITAKKSDGTKGATRKADRLFLDYEKLPNLPLLVFDVPEEDMSFEVAPKPTEQLWGWSIINSSYVHGHMSVISNDRSAIEDVPLKIRIRGNTSASPRKTPYKIRFGENVDLIEGNGETADQEWLLLTDGTSLRNYLGHYVSLLCGQEWQPRLRYVNVMIDGDWKGLYTVIESVRRGKSRMRIHQRGFIIENDPYWWKTAGEGIPDNADKSKLKGVHFKTEKQIFQLGFTIKYPKIKTLNDTRLLFLKDSMQQVENLLIKKDNKVFDFIDKKSFASFTLAQDILAKIDAGGSNMYFSWGSKKDDKYKWKLGPVWDMDGCFQGKPNEWGGQHAWCGTFTDHLNSMPEYRKEYARLWDLIREDLSHNINNKLDTLVAKEGPALNESRRLDASRWQNKLFTSLDDEVASKKVWFQERIKWINTKLSEKQWTQDINREP